MEIHDEPAKSVSTDALSADEQFLSLVRKRLDRSVTNETKEREAGNFDINFINGDQWPDDVKNQRGKKRLTLTINKLPSFLDQIDGDIRLNTPGPKVKAVDDVADPGTADVIEGLIRYVQRSSRASKVHSYAGLHAAAGGRGAWRIVTDFISEVDFKQEIKIKRIINAYSVYYDPGAEQDDKQDGMYFIIITDITKDAYKEEYGQDAIDFDHESPEYKNWHNDGMVRIAEYFYKDKIGTKKLYQMKNGSILTDEDNPNPEEIHRDREMPIYKIKWAKVDGKRILETEDIPGPMFPIVLTWGKQLCVNGKLEVRGIARHSRDSQMSINYFKSNDAEAAALQPKQPYIMPDVCLSDPFKTMWDNANDENYSMLVYKVSDKHPNLKPYRETPAVIGSANVQQIQMFEEDLRDTAGYNRAAIGKTSNETSGVAIAERKKESDTGQYAYVDNLRDAVVTENKIIIGMIPEVFDFETQLRIIGKDMKEKLVSVNDGNGIDLTVGKYDVDISTTGSYSTQREEFQEKILGLLPLLPPEQVALMTDILVEMQDFHRADDIAARIKKTIPKEFLEGEDDLDENEDGLPGDGEPGLETEPIEDPAMVMEMERQQLETDEQQAKTEQEQTKAEQEVVKLEGMRLDNAAKAQVSKEQIMALVKEAMLMKGITP